LSPNNYQIGAESSINADVLIDHWNRLLPHRAQTSAAQFTRQYRIVNRLQQARAKGCMNPVSGVDNLLGNGVLGHNDCSLVSRQAAKNAKNARNTIH
jgi:hypothetical protein